MTGTALKLVIATPIDIVVDAADVASFRAEDESGDFGILPGHVDLLTVLRAGVVRWRRAGAAWRFCAIRGGVLSMTNGSDIHIACRQAVTGDSLAGLEQVIARHRVAEEEDERRARLGHARLHAHAIRTIMRELGRSPGSGLESVFEETAR